MTLTPEQPLPWHMTTSAAKQNGRGASKGKKVFSSFNRFQAHHYIALDTNGQKKRPGARRIVSLS